MGPWGGAPKAAFRSREPVPPKKRFKLFHIAPFRMWASGQSEAVRNAFGAEVDAEQWRLSNSETGLRALAIAARRVNGV